MLLFKQLEITDKELFSKYLSEYNFNTYEYSFTTLYLWRKYCKVEYAVTHNTLIIKKTQEDKGTYFMQPIGYNENNIREVISELIIYKNNHPEMKVLFRDIEESFINVLNDILNKDIIIKEDENNFDYIYSAEELANLSGKKYHSKKNHYNQFIKSYNVEIKEINDEEVMNDCFELSQRWFDKEKEKTSELVFELQGIKELLENKDYLRIDTIAVYVEGKIAGFSIGERVNNKMAIIHIEKCDPEYQGVYAYINRTFVMEKYSDLRYINREEDLGIEGLRKAKMSYNPSGFVKKYIIENNNKENLKKCSRVVIINEKSACWR